MDSLSLVQTLSTKAISHNARLISINFAFWLLITLISATQLYVRFQDSYEGGWPNFVWRQGVVWAGWAILTPFIFYIIRRIANDNRIKNGLIHVLYALAFTISYSLILSFLSALFFDSETPILEFIRQSLINGAAANLLVYLLIVAFSLLLQYYERAKTDKERQYQLDLEVQSLEKQLVEAQLNNLKAQIQPHFLFNSLHSIASLIRKKELPLATETIASLSDLLRVTLKNQEKNLITLEEEIALISKYLDVEKIRFGENLNISINLESNTRLFKVPAFILQPIIENCFKHAFQESALATLIISAELKENNLHLTVEDNGNTAANNYEQSKSNGIGIKNVKQRLNTLYKENASFTTRTKADGGTIAEFLITIDSNQYE